MPIDLSGITWFIEIKAVETGGEIPMEEKTLLSTRELAKFLSINEKMVYTLIAEKNLPATKATGKWLFPRHLVEQWLEAKTINFPKQPDPLPPYDGLLIIAGSNDILLDRTISLINQFHPKEMVAFGNLGSLGGIRALRRNHCHIASSHLIQKDGEEYNFGFAIDELGQMPGIINFCRREQGLLIEKGNPRNIRSVADLNGAGIKIINRPLGTGTRLLLDEELTKAGIEGNEVDGYQREVSRHLDLGLEILSGRAQAGPCIRAVAELLDLDFIPIKWESFDLLILKDRFFRQGCAAIPELFERTILQEAGCRSSRI